MYNIIDQSTNDDDSSDGDLLPYTILAFAFSFTRWTPYTSGLTPTLWNTLLGISSGHSPESISCIFKLEIASSVGMIA